MTRLADCMELYLANELAAGGPGSGRHPEYGNFAKTFSSKKTTYYTAGKSKMGGGDSPRHVVIVMHPSRPSGATKVTERDMEQFNIHGNPSKETQVYRTYRNAGASQNNDFHEFMKSRYGISHED
jgi:hypothetical protein